MIENSGLFHGLTGYSMLYGAVNDAIRAGQLSLLMETMGKRIKRMRKQKNLSQSDLAKLLGLTKGAISQWELEQVENLRLKNMLQLLVIFDIDLPYLVYGEARKPNEVVPFPTSEAARIRLTGQSRTAKPHKN